jgi:holo-ACP synthase
VTVAVVPFAPPSQQPVSLDQVLANRDRRVERQRAALDRWRRPVLSLTLVFPGPHKDGAAPRALMAAALAAVDRLLAERWPVLQAEARFEPTGPEALRVVDADPLDLKRALVALEEAHPLGRLWDLDVICPERGSIPRKTLGLTPRRCLLCSESAHACARSRAHPLPDLLAAIETRLEAYRRG